METMVWFIVIIAFVYVAYIEYRKEKKHPGYRSWMDHDYHGWDQWRVRGKNRE
jgi:hypothetical protein